jgi:hypothetical protein
MAQGPRFALSLGTILTAVVIAVAITMWAGPPIPKSVSAAPTQPQEVIYRPQHLLLY